MSDIIHKKSNGETNQNVFLDASIGIETLGQTFTVNIEVSANVMD